MSFVESLIKSFRDKEGVDGGQPLLLGRDGKTYRFEQVFVGRYTDEPKAVLGKDLVEGRLKVFGRDISKSFFGKILINMARKRHQSPRVMIELVESDVAEDEKDQARLRFCQLKNILSGKMADGRNQSLRKEPGTFSPDIIRDQKVTFVIKGADKYKDV